MVFLLCELVGVALTLNSQQKPSHTLHRHEPEGHGYANVFALQNCPETFYCSPGMCRRKEKFKIANTVHLYHDFFKVHM